ncbi:MAG: hypothetical protein COT74_09505 [Bdellovibrionales bacterium CG10_big_fil_rev_8_21_14_0_10_45_34]|nr:MAG: hypothetical protein COT74_09505 [Bdellovibrionales bacterium CG10_big_fil_rev_8_21_14_0_10_45_34]
MPKAKSKLSTKSEVELLRAALAKKSEELELVKREMATLNSQIEGLIGGFEDQLRATQAIYGMLVPTHLPNVPGFKMSSKFRASDNRGGDYFDVFDLGSKFKFCVFMSSAPGHGASALLLSVLFRLYGEKEFKKASAPEKALSALLASIEQEWAASGEGLMHIAYAEIDRRSFLVRLASVGGIYVAAWREEEKQLEVLSVADENEGGLQKISTKSVQLRPLDRLILCSRGVVEQVGSDGQMFGMQRINEILADSRLLGSGPHEVRNEILFQLEEFAESEKPTRDQTVIVMEVESKSLRLAPTQ